MTARKHDIARAYAPDYVSAETLAYRLDLSPSTVEAYVRAGLLPRPEMIGSLMRWDFTEVKAFIKSRNAANKVEVGINGRPRDAYLERLKGGTPE